MKLAVLISGLLIFSTTAFAQDPSVNDVVNCVAVETHGNPFDGNYSETEFPTTFNPSREALEVKTPVFEGTVGYVADSNQLYISIWLMKTMTSVNTRAALPPAGVQEELIFLVQDVEKDTVGLAIRCTLK